MTVEESNRQPLDLDNLLFAQSSLFSESIPKKKNESQVSSSEKSISDIRLSDSFLLSDSTKPKEKVQSLNSSISGIDISHSTISSINDNFKEAKLFNGNTIKLKPRRKQGKDVDIAKLGMEETGSVINMDDLFNKVQLRNSLKESNERIRSISGGKEKDSSTDHQIWAEKYRPTKFIELCSAGNDKQYRLILHWLKKWSTVVFGEEPSLNESVDSLGRPYKKILLINGPSGIGKTVATHLLARQLGYSVQELNAANSMDTLPQASSTGNPYQNVSTALRLKIKNALTTNTITSNGKPTCLIIDEIDSSTNSNEIIKILNDLIQSDQRSMYKKYKYDKNVMQVDASDEIKNKKKNKKTKDFLLNRPIICIANDIYASGSSRAGSAMDKLRPLCDIISLKKPSSTRNLAGVKTSGNALRSVKEHLMWINEREHLGLDYQEIGEIVEVCDGDIRACLNYLQFSGRKLDLPYSNNKEESNKWNKDSQISWFAMVDLLFQRDPQLSKDENFDILMDSLMNGSGKSVTSNGSSFDKVIKGCFNKYLDVVHYQDDSLVKPSDLSDWLYFYDFMNDNSLNNNINYFPSLVSMKIWSLFSEINPNKNFGNKPLIPNIKNLDFESYDLLKRNKSVIKRSLEKLPISTKLTVGGGIKTNDTFACYFLPYLNKILTPESQSQNRIKSTLKPFEKILIEKIALIVKSFDLQLESHRDIDTSQVALKISPSWDTITNFDSAFAPMSLTSLSKHVQITRQWLFPLVQSELERLEMLKKASKRSLEQKPQKDAKAEEKRKRTKLSSSVEFFKGKYDGIASQFKEKPVADSNHEATRIWVKYNEGFSNAVRKHIGWSDLWLP